MNIEVSVLFRVVTRAKIPVEIMAEKDFEYVQKMCQKNPLNGNQLKVDRIEEIKSVQVKNVSSNVSSENLRSYFGDRKKSSGGDISSIQQETKDTYIVSFKEAFVVMDVCSRGHILQNVELDVQPFWEPSEENTISRQQVYDYSLPSKFHLSFLKKHKIIVNEKLKKWSEVLWEDSKINKLKLNYSEGNLEEIEHCLKDLLNSITVEIVDVPTDIFEDIVGTFNSEADQKYIYFDMQYRKVHILAFDKNNVIKMKNRLLDNLRTECEDDLDIHERRILSGLRFFEQAERQFEELKVTVHSNKVIFEGHCSKVTDCQNDMYKILRSIVKSELRLPINTEMIINKEPVKEYLDKKLRDNNCIGSWEPGDGDSVLLYASEKRHLSDLEKVMKQSFVANTLDFVDKIKGTPNQEKWLTFVESLKEEFPDFYSIGEDSIVAVDAVIDDIIKKIANFEQSLTYESYISMPLEHFRFLKDVKEQEINDFGEKNKMKNVCLKDNKLHVEGTQEQIRKMETFIGDLRKDISSKAGTFRSKNIQESEAGKNEMQNQSESIISLNSDLGSEAEEILNFKYKNCEIVLREGDITTLDTDAIVNAANGRLEHMGGIAAAIVRKGGFEIQIESNEIMEQRRIELKTGEVVLTKAGKLKCKTIIHAVGPVWNNGRNNEIFQLSKAVKNCLLVLEGKSYTSIAIPAISTGIYGIPIEKGTECIVETIQCYLDTHSNSKIKHICLIDVRKEVIRAFKHHLEKVFGISERGGTNSLDFHGPQQESSFMPSRTNVTSRQNAGIKINLMIDSISNAPVDVIVNSSNEELQLDKGSISKSILKTAGPQMQVECIQKYPQGISTSEIAVTKGYNLKCKNVFHLALPLWDEDSSDLILANVTQIIRICLHTAERMGAKSLAFPILGAGKLKYPIENLPRTMYEAVRNYSDRNPSQIKDVYFVVYPKDTEILKKFKEYFQGNTTGGSAASLATYESGSRWKDFITFIKKTVWTLEPFPVTWSTMKDKELMKIVPLTHGPEYDDVERNFRMMSSLSHIISIERIQNKTLYQRYQALKNQFEVENPNITNEVDGLWHGTAAGSVNGINKYGFNHSYCGKNGRYGEGVYFARDIGYSASDTYSTPDNHRIKKIYKCSILVGKMMQGQHGLRVLPDSYNSAVDDIQRPRIYVTFDDSQAYPHYLITFSD